MKDKYKLHFINSEIFVYRGKNLKLNKKEIIIKKIKINGY